MKLEQHIKENYDGKQYKFANANGYKPNQVSVMVGKGNYYVINGRLMIDKREIK